MKQLILIRGLPGSGKSTLAKTLAWFMKDECLVEHFEADMFFVNKEDQYIYDRNMIGAAHMWCQEQTVAALESDYVDTVIVSNTFTTKKELKPYFQLGKDFGITPIVYLAQNHFQNVHSVPQEVLCKMRARFEYDISDLFKDHIA
jgi:tRNA uridine 5-carbamoylmethylation protein Kti12